MNGTDKITILYIIDYFFMKGGAEKNLLQVVMKHDKDKYRPIVCYLQGGNLTDGLRRAGIEVKNINLEKIYGFKALVEGLKLYRFIKKEKVKIVVTYHESSDFWGGIVAKLAGVPVLISSRRDMGFNLKGRHVLFYKYLNILFDRIFVVSNAVGKVLCQTQNTNKDKLITVYNGIEPTDVGFSEDKAAVKRSLGLPEGDYPLIGILANIRPIKGYEYFIDAAAKVINEHPKSYFIIVGGWEGSDAYLKKLKNQVRELKLENHLIFTGARNNIPAIQSTLDISVISSLSEGFSNTILESMAAGKPVVATAVGGNPEAVVDGVTGILVPPSDASALAAGICRLLRDQAEAQRMGKEAAVRVNEYFTQQSMMEQLETTYDVLLQSSYSCRDWKLKSKAVKTAKLILSSFLYYTGLLSVCKQVVCCGRLKILAYHRVSNDVSFLKLNIPNAIFEEQMKYLKQKYNVISLGEAVDALRSGRALPRNSVAITFDDGYKSLLSNAVPILKKYNLPATVFLTVNPIEKHEPMWFDMVAYAIKNTPKKTLDLSKYGLGKYLLNTHEEKRNVAEVAASHVKTLNMDDAGAFITELLNRLKVRPNDRSGDAFDLLTWDEVRQMSGAGITLGAHTMNHHILANMTAQAADYEISESKRYIDSKTGIPAVHFAYPNGELSDFNRDIVDVLKSRGFISACTLISGSDNTDIYALRRMNVYAYMCTGMDGTFNKPLFAAEISGFIDYLRKK